MTLPQKKFREVVFQMLYSLDMGAPPIEALIPLMMKELSITKKVAHEALRHAEEILAKKETYDSLIGQYSKEYAFDRIPSVERNLLRLSLYEILDNPEISPSVTIVEALRLAKKFVTPEAGAFIHAILDQIIQSSLAENPESTKMQGNQPAPSDDDPKSVDPKPTA